MHLYVVYNPEKALGYLSKTLPKHFPGLTIVYILLCDINALDFRLLSDSADNRQHDVVAGTDEGRIFDVHHIFDNAGNIQHQRKSTAAFIWK